MLNIIFRQVWTELCVPFGHDYTPFRLMQLVTNGIDQFPNVRTVVLRGADLNQSTLTVFIDKRSQSYQELSCNSFVMFHAYDGERDFQLRMKGKANIADGERIAEHWHQLREASRELFSRGCPPRQILNCPEDAERDGYEIESDVNFAVVDVTISSFEVLDVSQDIHRRACFDRQAEGWTMAWIAP